MTVPIVCLLAACACSQPQPRSYELVVGRWVFDPDALDAMRAKAAAIGAVDVGAISAEANWVRDRWARAVLTLELPDRWRLDGVEYRETIGPMRSGTWHVQRETVLLFGEPQEGDDPAFAFVQPSTVCRLGGANPLLSPESTAKGTFKYEIPLKRQR